MRLARVAALRGVVRPLPQGQLCMMIPDPSFGIIPDPGFRIPHICPAIDPRVTRCCSEHPEPCSVTHAQARPHPRMFTFRRNRHQSRT